MRALIIFFDIMGMVRKEFVLASQTINSPVTVTFHGDCMKMCEHFTPELWRQKIGCYTTTMNHLTLPVSPRNFFTKNMTVFSHPPSFSVSPIEEKTERPPF
jgi:hypothetical protein